MKHGVWEALLVWVTEARHGDGQGPKPPQLSLVSCSREGPALWPSPRRTASLPPCVPTTRKERPSGLTPLITDGGDSCTPRTPTPARTHAVLWHPHMPGGTRAHMREPPRAHTCCGPAHRHSQLPGGHRTLVGSAGSLCHQQHLGGFPGNPLPCTFGLGPEGSVRRSVALTITVTF